MASDLNFQELKYLDSIFKWLKEKGHHLNALYILGGEPFIQPQSDRLLDLLENSGDKFKNLELFFFSNLSSINVTSKVDRLKKLQDDRKLYNAHIVGSIDCWGKEAEYVRFGLDTKLFDENMKYIIEADLSTTINLCWSPLSTFTMPDLIEKYREWNELAISNKQPWGMNISLMQAAGKEWMHPSIFGPQILDWGYNQSIDRLKNISIPGWDNNILPSTLEYFEGIRKSINEATPDKEQQHKLHKYLTELDRRRGTDYRELFPILYEEIHKQ